MLAKENFKEMAVEKGIFPAEVSQFFKSSLPVIPK